MILDYFTTVCPKCNQESINAPNPYYTHTCANCDETYSSGDLIKVVDDEKIFGRINELKNLMKRFPGLSEFKKKGL
jgi:hypothetical protein